jgi:hypothetical protein
MCVKFVDSFRGLLWQVLVRYRVAIQRETQSVLVFLRRSQCRLPENLQRCSNEQGSEPTDLTVRQRVALTNGGVPPFGHSTQLRVFVDPDLLQYDEVWAAAGTWNDNFGAAPADIVRVAGGVVTDLKRD